MGPLWTLRNILVQVQVRGYSNQCDDDDDIDNPSRNLQSVIRHGGMWLRGPSMK